MHANPPPIRRAPQTMARRSWRRAPLLALLGLATACTYDWDPSTAGPPPGDGDVSPTDATDPGSGECVLRVDALGAAEAPDGSSWARAYPRLQSGIDAAASRASAARPCEVWVARGTYYVFESNPNNTVRLAPFVEVLGGFAGDEQTRAERDWRARETALSGRNGPSGDLRVYHVVIGADDAVLDGFTITEGRADGVNDLKQSGAGMLNEGVSPTVRNCTFLGNEALLAGGGMLIRDGAPRLEGCVFRDNTAERGGGLYNDGAASVLASVLLARNEAEREGGAVYSRDSEVTLSSCTFVDNVAGSAGGALFGDAASDITVTNSVLWGNTAAGAPEPLAGPASLTVTHSVVEGGQPGAGNLDADPRFVAAASGDYRLAAGSACIDAGDGARAPALDLDGLPRRDDPETPNTGVGSPAYVDLGAYEYQPTATPGDDDE